MNKEHVRENLLRILPIGALVVFLVQELRYGNIQTWILTDVLIITFGIGTFFEGIFTRQIESVNRKSIDLRRTPPLGRTWLFMGLLFGVLTAGLLGQLVSEIATMPTEETVPLLIEDTGLAAMFVVFVFVSRYVPKRRRRSKGDFFLDG